MRKKIEELKQPTIAEIKSYSDPPSSVGEVMKATFLLLGESYNDIQVNMKKLRSPANLTGFFRNGQIFGYSWGKWARTGSYVTATEKINEKLFCHGIKTQSIKSVKRVRLNIVF